MKSILIIISSVLDFTKMILAAIKKWKRKKAVIKDKQNTEDIKKEVDDGELDKLNKRWGWNDDKK